MKNFIREIQENQQVNSLNNDYHTSTKDFKEIYDLKEKNNYKSLQEILNQEFGILYNSKNKVKLAEKFVKMRNDKNQFSNSILVPRTGSGFSNYKQSNFGIWHLKPSEIDKNIFNLFYAKHGANASKQNYKMSADLKTVVSSILNNKKPTSNQLSHLQLGKTLAC